MKSWWQKIFGKQDAEQTRRSRPPRPEAVPAQTHYRDEAVGNDASARPWEFDHDEALALATKTKGTSAACKMQTEPQAISHEFRPDVPVLANSGLLRSPGVRSEQCAHTEASQWEAACLKR